MSFVVKNTVHNLGLSVFTFLLLWKLYEGAVINCKAEQR